MSKFPKRTVESDLRAFLVQRALDAVSAPKNYMVCVVTIEGGDVAVACSGSGDPVVMLKVAVMANWQEQLKSMALSKSQRDNVRKLISKFEKLISQSKELDKSSRTKLSDARHRLNVNDNQLPDLNRAIEKHGQVSLIRAPQGNAVMAENLTVPVRDQRIVLKEDSMLLDVSSKFGRRDCAEPRALELAAKSGRRLTGMTTIWYGNVARNDYVDDRQLADVTISAASPCEWCVTNEARIMMHVADTIAEANPQQRPTLQRRHSMPDIRA